MRRATIELARVTINPPFLRRIDTQLLVTRPRLWSLRLHRAAYFGVVIAIFALFLGLVPINHPATLQRDMGTRILLISALQVGAIILWLYGQNRFSVTHEYGRQYDKKGWSEFFGYVVAFLFIFASLPLFLTAMRSQLQRANPEQIAAEQLVLRVAQFEINQGQNEWGADRDLFTSVSERLDTAEGQWERFFTESYGYYNYYNTPAGEKPVSNFIDQWVTSAALTPYTTTPDNGENPLLPLIAKYSRRTLTDVAEAEQAWGNNSFQYGDYRDTFEYMVGHASDNSNRYFQIVFDDTQTYIRNVWLVLFAAAFHAAMLRVIVKYTGRRSLILTIASVVGLMVFFWLTAVLSYPIRELLGYGWSSNFEDNYFSVLLCLFLGLVFVSYLRLRQVPNAEHFGRMQAIRLGLFPIFLAVLPFALLALFEIQTGGYFGDHFIQTWNTDVWSLSPLGYWMMYAAQFSYVPMIPFMKRRFVRMQSLPKA